MLFRFPLCGIIVLLIVWFQFGPSLVPVVAVEQTTSQMSKYYFDVHRIYDSQIIRPGAANICTLVSSVQRRSFLLCLIKDEFHDSLICKNLRIEERCTLFLLLL